MPMDRHNGYGFWLLQDYLFSVVEMNDWLERRDLWGTVNHDEFSQSGWVSKTDEAKQIFMRGVAEDLCWMNEEATGVS